MMKPTNNKLRCTCALLEVSTGGIALHLITEGRRVVHVG
jgi:hypothetical protein